MTRPRQSAKSEENAKYAEKYKSTYNVYVEWIQFICDDVNANAIHRKTMNINGLVIVRPIYTLECNTQIICLFDLNELTSQTILAHILCLCDECVSVCMGRLCMVPPKRSISLSLTVITMMIYDNGWIRHTLYVSNAIHLDCNVVTFVCKFVSV